MRLRSAGAPPYLILTVFKYWRWDKVAAGDAQLIPRLTLDAYLLEERNSCGIG
jgi:hypothetical protein